MSPTANRLATALLLVLGGIALSSAAAPREGQPDPPGAEPGPPNVIVLVTDDHRADALGVAGNPVVQTPHLDALAAAGTRFENGYATTSICMTSRASIYTGQYARRHQVDTFEASLSPEQTSDSYIGRLYAAGYFSGFLGKWGLGLGGGVRPDTLFDVWRGVQGQGSYYATDDDGQPIHLTRLLEQQAVAFLRQAAEQPAPFHLSLSFKAPHVEGANAFIPDPEYDALYAGVPIPLPADTAYFDTESLPASEFEQNPREEGRNRWRARFADDATRQENVRRYYRLITGADRAVGAIRAELDRLGMADNTVIVFLGDNGLYLGEHGLAGKWYGHDPSIRIPLLVYDPRVSAAARGQVRSEMALNIDVAPTVLDLLGLPVPDGVQGRSLRPLVYGQDVADWRREFFYEHRFTYGGRIPPTEGVVGERYKYLLYLDPHLPAETLFDREADPDERVDWSRRLAERPELADTLAAMRQRWAAYCEGLR